MDSPWTFQLLALGIYINGRSMEGSILNIFVICDILGMSLFLIYCLSMDNLKLKF